MNRPEDLPGANAGDGAPGSAAPESKPLPDPFDAEVQDETVDTRLSPKSPSSGGSQSAGSHTTHDVPSSSSLPSSSGSPQHGSSGGAGRIGSSGSRGSSLSKSLADEKFEGYEILDEIHRGGQGVVYRAIHLESGQTVAIKVIRIGPLADESDRARFEREVDILEQLDHPNVVTVFDNGSGPGYFYYVMEYIEGSALDDFIKIGRLSIRKRLRLLAKVCNGVNAAHLRGVIHRDLKPSNIRVDMHGEPHVLDFGLAKNAEDHTATMTQTGQFVGSLPWASPEQAEGSSSSLDVRTDVYSLGVILFQLLVGEFPYEVRGTMRDVLERIVTIEPPAPSSVNKDLDDELDTIILKALAKDRERRYQTAGEIGRDLDRYLAGEPIEAKRDSLGYQLRKNFKRYRIVAGVAAAYVLFASLGLVGGFYLFWQQSRVAQEQAELAESRAHEARLAEQQAEDARSRAEDARLEAERLQVAEAEARAAAEISAARSASARLEAEQSEAQAREVINFTRQLLQQIGFSARDARNQARPAQLHRVLDSAMRALQRQGRDLRPNVEVDLRITLADTYEALGRYDRAQQNLRRAIDLQSEISAPESIEVLALRSRLGELYVAADSLDRADLLLERTYDLQVAALGEEAVASLETRARIAELRRRQGRPQEALAMLEDTHQTLNRRFGITSGATQRAWLQLQELRGELGQTTSVREPLRNITLRGLNFGASALGMGESNAANANAEAGADGTAPTAENQSAGNERAEPSRSDDSTREP